MWMLSLSIRDVNVNKAAFENCGEDDSRVFGTPYCIAFATDAPIFVYCGHTLCISWKRREKKSVTVDQVHIESGVIMFQLVPGNLSQASAVNGNIIIIVTTKGKPVTQFYKVNKTARSSIIS